MNLLPKMIGMLTSAYTKKDERNARLNLPLETEIGQLFSILSWGLGAVEDNTERIREWKDIDKARGATLDRHGKNYGVERGGADDAFYRLLIKVKLIAQLSGGDIDTVINAVMILYDLAPEYVELEERFPAKIRVFVDDGQITQEQKELSGLISKMTKRIVAAGVGFDIVFKIPHVSHARIGVGATSYRRVCNEISLPRPQARESHTTVRVGAVLHTYRWIKDGICLPMPKPRKSNATIYAAAVHHTHRRCVKGGISTHE